MNGLLVIGAAEIVTMAGGLRRGSTQGETAVLAADVAGGLGAPEAPVVACWDGADRGRRSARDRRGAQLEAQGLPLARFARLDAAAGPSRRASSTPIPTCSSPARARTSCSSGRRARATSRSWRRAAGSSRRSPPHGRPTTTTLAAHGRRWLGEMLSHGTTTIEAKSGYGLDLPTELRLLEIAYQLGRAGPVEVVPTFLGAHAVPAEFRTRPDGTEAYVRSVIEDQIPGVAAQGRARFCDVFCEQGVFTADQRRRVLEAAAGYGLRPRLHADEIAPSGGAELAAELGAASADHLATPSEAGIAALAPCRRLGPAGRRDAPAGDDLVPHEEAPRAGPPAHQARAYRSRSAPTSTRAPRRRPACRWR